MKVLKLFFVLSVALGTSPMIFADDYYDDDIYFDESKAKQKNTKVEKSSSATQSYNYGYSYSGSTRDVDEYNRRGAYNSEDSVAYDSVLTQDGYVYTNRIERFYNPE